MTVVSLRYDSARLGCGERCFVVLQTGRKWVTLFYPPLLLSIKIGKADFVRLARPIQVNARKMAARIRANRRQAKRLELPDGGKAARAAIASLQRKAS